MAIRKRARKGRDVWVHDYRDSDGVRRWATFARKRDAEAHEEAVRLRKRRGELVAPVRVTLSAYGAEARRRWAVKASTRREYERILDGRVEAALGAVALQDLTRGRLREWDLAMRAEGLGRQSRAQAMHVVRMVLREAVEDGYLLRNPADGVRPGRGVEERQRIPEGTFSPLEEREALSYTEAAVRLFPAPSPWGAMLAAALWAGLRLGELLALGWEDVEFPGEGGGPGWLSVRRSLDRVEGPGAPKSAAGVRRAPLLAEGVAPLRELWMAQGRPKGGRVFMEPAPKEGGEARLAGYYGMKWRHARVLADIGARVFAPKELRDVWASILIKRGVQPKTLQKWIGHAQFATTMDLYAKFTREDDPRSLEALGGRGS